MSNDTVCECIASAKNHIRIAVDTDTHTFGVHSQKRYSTGGKRNDSIPTHNTHPYMYTWLFNIFIANIPFV